jgi:hypothetical protein
MRAQVSPLNAAAQTNSDVSTRLIAVVYGVAVSRSSSSSRQQVMSALLADAFIAVL